VPPVTKHDKDAEYLETVLKPIRVCASYLPKFGKGKAGGVSLPDFRALYQADPFYFWFGLDDPLMYAAHKAAGGMTSIYRQIGIGCEKLFRRILVTELCLAPEDVAWSYSIIGANEKERKLSLDGRLQPDTIKDVIRRRRVQRWLETAMDSLHLEKGMRSSIKGVVFEVRQGYKSKDSKRQNADISNAATAYTKAFLPCVVVLSTQIDSDLLIRYRNERWLILVGTTTGDSLSSTYAFMKDVIGYDLAGFFSRNAPVLRKEIRKVLEALLRPT